VFILSLKSFCGLFFPGGAKRGRKRKYGNRDLAVPVCIQESLQIYERENAVLETCQF